MFDQNDQEKKLDWMYKGANSHVDREEYLLGRKVDKTLDQLNTEEKQIGAVLPPKNHVEHECIPPSIRDYKLQQQLAEQVDLQAKLQEDPLISIKKREEETRRQFLQNPVQLKKLQKALSKQQKKLKKHKKSDLDTQLAEKLHLLKDNPLAIGLEKESKKGKKEKDLDIILMHKFNFLKAKLSEKDLQDIMEGNVTSSEDSSSDSEESDDYKEVKLKQFTRKYGSSEDLSRKPPKPKHNIDRSKKRSPSSSDGDVKKKRKKHTSKHRKDSDTSEDSSSDDEKKKKRKKKSKKKKKDNDASDGKKHRKKKSRKKKQDSTEESSSDDSESEEEHKSDKVKLKSSKESNYRSSYDYDKKDRMQMNSRNIERTHESKRSHDYKRRTDNKETYNKNRDDYKKRTSRRSHRSRSRSRGKGNARSRSLEKLAECRNARNRSNSRDMDSDSSTDNDKSKRIIGPRRPKHSSDSEEDSRKIKNWGLVKSDGTKIPLTRNKHVPKQDKQVVEEPKKEQPVKRKKLSEEEKDRLRREMMKDAVKRDEDRARNIKKYRENEVKEDQKEYKADFIHKELLKSANNSTVESRIRSNLNNIQRSGKDMNAHFSKRN